MLGTVTFSEVAMNLFTAGIHVTGMSIDEDNPNFGFESVMGKGDEIRSQPVRLFFFES